MEAHHWHDVTVLMIPIAGVWSKLTCAGLKTSWAHRRQDVTMLAISITGIRSIKSSCSKLECATTPAQRLVSILSLIDQVSIDGAGAVDQMSRTDPPG